jgi:hypothetical protein
VMMKLLFSGVKDIISIDHIIAINEPFCEDKINICFIDCDDYGYILTEILYGGRKLVRYFTDSNIEVKSGKHSLEINEAIEVFKLIKPGKYLEKYLEVKFKNQNI